MLKGLVSTPLDHFVSWPHGGGFQQVVMFINGRPLLEIVRELELPHVRNEHDQRVSDGESKTELGHFDSLAGQYLYLPPEVALPPSENFFGKPYDHGFVIDDDDPMNEKSLILQCTCGITDCWFLTANITIGKTVVRWQNFQQFHRDWRYNFCGFTFDRQQYESAFKNA